jgi:branched-chain amino acid transport system permease protein
VVGYTLLHTGLREVFPLLLASFGIGLVMAFLTSPLLRGGRGFAFGMISLALGQLAFLFALRSGRVPGGSDGIFSIPRGTFLGIDLNDETSFYYLCVGTLAVSVVALVFVRRSMVGRAMRGIRDSSDRAVALGVPVWRYQSLALSLSGAFTGLAGCLFVLRDGAVNPDVFYWTQGAVPVLAGLIGGIRTVTGPILGAIVYAKLQDWFREWTDAWQLWTALVVVAIALVAPRGIVSLVGVARELWRSRHDRRPMSVGTAMRRLRSERA